MIEECDLTQFNTKTTSFAASRIVLWLVQNINQSGRSGYAAKDFVCWYQTGKSIEDRVMFCDMKCIIAPILMSLLSGYKSEFVVQPTQWNTWAIIGSRCDIYIAGSRYCHGRQGIKRAGSGWHIKTHISQLCAFHKYCKSGGNVIFRHNCIDSWPKAYYFRNEKSSFLAAKVAAKNSGSHTGFQDSSYFAFITALAHFFVPTKQLCEWFSTSIRQSDTPFSLCFRLRIIMKFSVVTVDRRYAHAKGQD